jgi:hypothetical protein
VTGGVVLVMVILFGPSELKTVLGILMTKFLRYFFGVKAFGLFVTALEFLLFKIFDFCPSIFFSGFGSTFSFG